MAALFRLLLAAVVFAAAAAGAQPVRVDHADAELVAADPRRNIAASVIVGILLGLGFAVGLEYLNRRVRTPDDLAVPEGVPMLGILRAKPVRHSFKERLDALGSWLDGMRRRRQPEPAR